MNSVNSRRGLRAASHMPLFRAHVAHRLCKTTTTPHGCHARQNSELLCPVRPLLQRTMLIRNSSSENPMDDSLPPDGMIRKMWIGEAVLYCDHLLRLDPDSRRNRFGGAVSDDYIRAYVERSFPRAVIHGFFVSGVLRGAAELHTLSPPHDAEAAISIERPWQSHGVGSVLLARTLLSARNRSIKFLRMACLADNRRMQDLARKFNAELSFDFGSVIGEVATPRATPLSMMRELLADSHGVTTTMFDVQSRLLRPA
jgi:hypothetical protein